MDVDLGRPGVESWREVPDVQPPVSLEEYPLVTEIVAADPRWRAAMHRRGFSDLSEVVVDGWASGPAPGTRLLRGITCVQGDQVNYFGRPGEGLVAVADLTARRVVEVVDRGVVPVAAASQELTPEAIGPERPALPPLNVHFEMP